MYWHIKYPLIFVGSLILAGCLYLLWSRLPERPARDGGGGDSAPARQPAVAEIGKTAQHEAEAARAALRQRLATAEGQLAKDNPVGARALAEKVLAAPHVTRFSELWFQAGDVVSKANIRILNSDVPAPEKIRYVVQPGDTLIGIANRFQTTVTAIERGNKLDTTRVTVYPGMVISIYPAKWSVEVLKTRFILLLYDDTRLFQYYRVGIGRQDRTPVGVFRIATKLREPVWTPPGRVIPYGDPANVLGTRWLGLQPIGETDPNLKGFGLHGTWQPETIGTAASEGCVRLKNEEIEQLFEVLPINTRITIREE